MRAGVGWDSPYPSHTRPCAPAFSPSVPAPGKDSAQEDSYDETGEEHRRIQALDLMAVAMGCKVEGPMVGDAARRIRVKPLSRPQTQQMPPQPP